MWNLGTEQDVTLPDGRVFTLGRLELRAIRQWRDWIAEQIGDPFATAERFIDRLPPEQVMGMIREAEAVQRDLRSFHLGCDLAQRYLATEEGAARILLSLMLQRHPQATLEDALQVMLAIEEKGRLAQVLEKASGEVPEGNGAGPRGPSTGTPSAASSSTGTCTSAPGKSTG